MKREVKMLNHGDEVVRSGFLLFPKTCKTDVEGEQYEQRWMEKATWKGKWCDGRGDGGWVTDQAWVNGSEASDENDSGISLLMVLLALAIVAVGIAVAYLAFVG